MHAVSLASALDAVLAEREKLADIATSPKAFFVHVRVPPHVVDRLEAVQRRVMPPGAHRQDIDHVTLVYTRKPLEDHPPEKVHAALSALRALGEQTEPIDARIQGWAYFDGASRAGKPATALVALLDAPGLEHLHVDASRALAEHGIEASDKHVFTPHITIGYLPQHGRVQGHLEPLEGRFTIDKVHVASRDHHEVPLTATPSIGQKAAAAAWRDRLPGGVADRKTPKSFDARQLAKGQRDEREHTRSPAVAKEIAMDHLAKDPRYYDKQGAMIPRGALLGAGLGAGVGALGSAADYATDDAAQRATQPLLKRVLVNAGVGALGGGLVGATHQMTRPGAQATVDIVDSLDQQRYASIGEDAARLALG